MLWKNLPELSHLDAACHEVGGRSLRFTTISMVPGRIHKDYILGGVYSPASANYIDLPIHVSGRDFQVVACRVWLRSLSCYIFGPRKYL